MTTYAEANKLALVVVEQLQRRITALEARMKTLESRKTCLRCNEQFESTVDDQRVCEFCTVLNNVFRDDRNGLAVTS
jgi:recombinational DNA repair protein RecR